jgi:hypothetical protein
MAPLPGTDLRARPLRRASDARAWDDAPTLHVRHLESLSRPVIDRRRCKRHVQRDIRDFERPGCAGAMDPSVAPVSASRRAPLLEGARHAAATRRLSEPCTSLTCEVVEWYAPELSGSRRSHARRNHPSTRRITRARRRDAYRIAEEQSASRPSRVRARVGYVFAHLLAGRGSARGERVGRAVAHDMPILPNRIELRYQVA